MAGNIPKGRHQPPARGVLAGIKADAERAKDLNRPFDPSTVGNAWSHNFLNQKPWHPLNFRNQARVYEAEQESIRQAKANQQAKAEFDAEQDYMKTLSYLSQEEQERYKARQSVSFLYTKPPGFSEIGDKIKEGKGEEKEGAVVGSNEGGKAAEGGGRGRERGRPDGSQRSHVVNMLGAIAALHSNEKWEVKHVSAMGRRSPPRGGLDPLADNQQLIVGESDEEAGQLPQQLPPSSKRERKFRKLEEAQEVLRAAGLLEAAQELLSREQPQRQAEEGKQRQEIEKKEEEEEEEQRQRR
eukprot:jgi/Botrbrau1/9812/Bobra.0322s0017.2